MKTLPLCVFNTDLGVTEVINVIVNKNVDNDVFKNVLNHITGFAYRFETFYDNTKCHRVVRLKTKGGKYISFLPILGYHMKSHRSELYEQYDFSDQAFHNTHRKIEPISADQLYHFCKSGLSSTGWMKWYDANIVNDTSNHIVQDKMDGVIIRPSFLNLYASGKNVGRSTAFDVVGDNFGGKITYVGDPSVGTNSAYNIKRLLDADFAERLVKKTTATGRTKLTKLQQLMEAGFSEKDAKQAIIEHVFAD